MSGVSYRSEAVKKIKEDLFGASNAAYSHLKGISLKKGSIGYEMINELKKIEEGYKNRYAEVEFYKRKEGGKLESTEAQKVFNEFRKFDEKNREKYANLRNALKEFSKAYSDFKGGRTNLKPFITKGRTGYYNVGYERLKREKPKVEPDYKSAGNFINRMERELSKVKKSVGEADYKSGGEFLKRIEKQIDRAKKKSDPAYKAVGEFTERMEKQLHRARIDLNKANYKSAGEALTRIEKEIERAKKKVEPNYKAVGDAISRMEKQLGESYRKFGEVVTEEAQKLSEKLALPSGKPWIDLGITKEEYKAINEKFPELAGNYTNKNIENALKKIGKEIGELRQIRRIKDAKYRRMALEEAKKVRESANKITYAANRGEKPSEMYTPDTNKINQTYKDFKRVDNTLKKAKELRKVLEKLAGKLKGGN